MALYEYLLELKGTKMVLQSTYRNSLYDIVNHFVAIFFIGQRTRWNFNRLSSVDLSNF